MRVQWQPWSPASFARARREGKPIFVNVAAGWCHWCHVMDHDTFGNAAIAKMLDRRFIAIRVDADQRPDVAERYSDWGWPANAFLTPEAQGVLELRGYQEPKGFLVLLKDLDRRARRGALTGRLVAPSLPAAPNAHNLPDSLEDLRAQLLRQLELYRDAGQGGWGGPQKYPFAGPVEHFLLADPAGAAATQALRGMEQLIDPVWGGMFQYSVGGTWSEPHFEKIAVIQAGALTIFSQASTLTSSARWVQAANDIARYIRVRLRRPDGALATSEDADAEVPGPRFYSLDAEARARLRPPRRDDNAYADWNGLMATALVAHWAATGAQDSLECAQGAVARLLKTHQIPGGPAFWHGEPPAPGTAGRADGLLHLRDNAAMGRALLAVGQAVPDPAMIRHALALADWLVGALASPTGAFWAHTADPEATGVFATRRTPLEENGLAIRFLIEAAMHASEAQAVALRKAAQRAAEALGDPATLAAEAQIVGQFLLGLDWLLQPEATIHLVGDDPALRRAAMSMVGPRAVKPAPLGEYPATPAPAAYVCRGTTCSRPITDPAWFFP